LLVPIATSAAYFFFHFLSVGALPRFSYKEPIWNGWWNQLLKASALAVFVGGTAVFPLALFPALIRTKRNFDKVAPFLIAVFLAGIFIPLVMGDISVFQAALMSPLAAAGVAVLYTAFKGVWVGTRQIRKGPGPEADTLFLSLWILGVSLLSFALLPFVSVRHLLLMFPALVLIFIRGVEKLFSHRSGLRPVFLAGTLIFGGLLIGIPAAVSDYRLSGAYRELAEEFGKEYHGTNEKVWFLGEFDFRYYMNCEGFSYLSERSRDKAKPGDILITSEVAYFTPPVPESAECLYTCGIPDGFPVRVQNGLAGAGFYNHLTGPLPVMLSRADLDYYSVYRLR
jgi:hypothetical protein